MDSIMTNKQDMCTRTASGRREFLAAAGAAIAAMAAGNVVGAEEPEAAKAGMRKPAAKRTFELGLASYTLRKFPLDETLAMTRRVGLKYICLKSFHLPL